MLHLRGEKETTRIWVNGICIGGEEPALIAGPCSIESKEQIEECAKGVSRLGIKLLRGGAFKPRSSPYSFQGLGEVGFIHMREAADMYGLSAVSEVMDGEQLAMALDYVDVIQIGARNMQNFSLLKRLGGVDKPILLKRGPSATYEELLLSAEYVLSRGNPNVILCERGIRTFETYTRNTLDLAAVPILQELSHLPVIVDPSHGVGVRRFVLPMAKAALAVGAHGVMIEAHPHPEEALSDREQTVSFEKLAEFMESYPFQAAHLK